MLEQICDPANLKNLPQSQMADLTQEIRNLLVQKVTATGGHLGPNLGVVELTLALHRVFDSPYDPIIFDTGHQAYVHKIITGRAKHFKALRLKNGLSGYPSRSESKHDWVESSHASSALSYSDGLAKALKLLKYKTCHVVAVVGDGALTGGMCWEALNNITSSELPLVVVINDNGRSYAPTVGGFAKHLTVLRLQKRYRKAANNKNLKLIYNLPLINKLLHHFTYSTKIYIKNILTSKLIFTKLGIKYIGPIDGHNEYEIENALRRARDFMSPVIVHVVTQKGMGYTYAENDKKDQMHTCGVINSASGLPKFTSLISWTSIFSEELIKISVGKSNLVAITAAMSGPTGLNSFQNQFPERFFDVGIAEQHAMTSAAGLAMGGLHPIVAIYSTFLNRAFDQLMMDVALHKLPVTLVLDRAGITGPDGASHNGVWDLSILGIIPGIQVAVPRDSKTLKEELREALTIQDGPTAIRFPTGAIGENILALERYINVDLLAMPSTNLLNDVLLIVAGSFAIVALTVANRLNNQGIGTTVIDPRWVLPVSKILHNLVNVHRLVVTIEDNGLHGGIGSSISLSLRHANIDIPCRNIGIPQAFNSQATRNEVLYEVNFTDTYIVYQITSWLEKLSF